ncbi:hypothetical protein BGP84_26595 [Pseudomonas putida]|uniref:Uncharacterized protein n=1 Tax=Pseudomonas putida TaxID=303 RepID=A0A2S3WYK2_PSEPU|nr:hypothetical protein BGP84_26595 [Pseudomonas putida]
MKLQNTIVLQHLMVTTRLLPICRHSSLRDWLILPTHKKKQLNLLKALWLKAYLAPIMIWRITLN